MAQIFEINSKRIFSLDEARRLLPIVRRVTKVAAQELDRLSSELSMVREKPRRVQLEAEVHSLFFRWQEKIKKLGGEAKGMWIVDFDTGEGYYCWHHPESDIAFYHGYSHGFRGRVPLTNP